VRHRLELGDVSDIERPEVDDPSAMGIDHHQRLSRRHRNRDTAARQQGLKRSGEI
jgi:hypothetical protein